MLQATAKRNRNGSARTEPEFFSLAKELAGTQLDSQRAGSSQSRSMFREHRNSSGQYGTVCARVLIPDNGAIREREAVRAARVGNSERPVFCSHNARASAATHCDSQRGAPVQDRVLTRDYELARG